MRPALFQMTESSAMTSTRPYLIRAMYEWLVDNNCTPHLLVEVKDDYTRVPRQFVDKGVIVLNVSPTAVKFLQLGNERITFSARFGGTPQDVDVPVSAVQAIYARENGQGIFLGESETAPSPTVAGPTESPPQPPRPGGKGPHLTVVK